VVIGGQKVSTFKQPIAEEANALQGSTVEARVSVEQKGDYTNYTLLAVKLVDAAGGSIPIAGASVPAGATTAPSSTIPVAAPSEYQRERTPKESSQIIRQSSAATAFAYAGQESLGIDAAFDLAAEIENYALHGSRYGAQSANVAAVGAAETSDNIPW
jgi:hypothetical protein